MDNITNDKATELWNKTWTPETHTTEYAAKRIKSAQSAKLTPVKIDHDDMYGYFQGSHGRYETFLDYCPCGDFIRSKLPCKHIYRLAIELGVLKIAVQANINAIPTPQAERIDFAKTVDIIESLPENAQRTLLTISCGRNVTSPTCIVRFGKDVAKLLESGIIIESDPQIHKVQYGKKDEIISFLNEENIPYEPKAKKDLLIDICQKQALEKAKEKFGYTIQVGIPTEYSATQIHSYLHRKFDYDYYYDLLNGCAKAQLLDTILPDDIITKQLIKHGHYSFDGQKVIIDHSNEGEIEFHF